MDQNKALEIYKIQTGKLIEPQKKYRLMGIMIFCIACGLLLVRTFITLISPYLSDTGSSVLFSLLIQVALLVIMPLLFYKFAFKMNTKEILKFSNFRKTKWFNYILAAGIGIVAMFVTIGISTFWQVIISLFGFTNRSGGDTLPANFNFGLFILSLFLSAVLPGVCEEFAMRGGFMTTMRKSFSFKITIIIIAVSFGLFHQNIKQVFYTCFFGLLMGALTLKTGSIFPSMIIHFFNNGTSIYLEHAEKYGWWGGNFYKNLDIYLKDGRGYIIFIAYILVCAVLAGLIFLFYFLNSTERLKKKKEIIMDSGYDVTNKRVVLIGAENKEMVKELGLDQEVYGEIIKENLYKPTLKDNVFFIGAIVVTAISTIFTFVFGLVV